MRLFGVLLRQSLSRIFSYRVNFWVQFWGSAITEVLIAYFLWFSLFEAQGVTEIGGYSFQEMMIYYLLISFVGRLIRGIENFEISKEIYEGTLTRYLLYPHNYFTFKFADHLAYTGIGLLQAFIAGGLVSIFFPEALKVLRFEWIHLPVYLVSILLASIFHFMLMSLLELVAFWADNVWSLLVMARFIISFFGGFYLPLALFPQALQSALAWTPFPALTFLPVQYLMGKVAYSDLIQGLFILVFWILVLAMMMSLVWARGKYKFSGVGQ